MKNINFVFAIIFSLVSVACSASPVINSNENLAAKSETPATASTPIAGGGSIVSTAPQTIVAELYKLHDKQKGPFFQSKDRALVDKFFAKPIADLIWKANNGPAGEVGAIDFDPLYDGQDFEIKNLAFTASDVKETTATVTANFLNFGEKRSVKFLMKSVDANWKIDDIKYNEYTLMETLKEYFANDPAKGSENAAVTGDFEGRYTVGTTSCTVKPVKMAFEVKWAKGSGSEMFYAAGENTFESEEGKTGVNRFEFTDENYNTGTFYRGDGKSFTVKRAK